MIELKEIKKNYRNKEVLKGVNFSFEVGEVVGIIGPNGVGKTTLIKIISGLIRSFEGKVELNKSKAKALVESPSFYTEMSGRNNIEYFLGKKCSEEEQNFLESTCMDFLDLPVRKYSMGMRQKLALSMLAVSDADYLLLDEPTVSLDAQNVEEFNSIIKAIKGSKGILISSHDLAEIENICDRVLILHDGVIAKEVENKKEEQVTYQMKFEGILNTRQKEKLKELMVKIDGNTLEYTGRKFDIAMVMKKILEEDLIVYELSQISNIKKEYNDITQKEEV